MKKLVWSNKKFGGRRYEGFYEMNRGEREFTLICKDKRHRVVFESHEAAKDLGWVGK